MPCHGILKPVYNPTHAARRRPAELHSCSQYFHLAALPSLLDTCRLCAGGRLRCETRPSLHACCRFQEVHLRARDPGDRQSVLVAGWGREVISPLSTNRSEGARDLVIPVAFRNCHARDLGSFDPLQPSVICTLPFSATKRTPNRYTNSHKS